MAKQTLDLMVDIETLSTDRDKGLVISVGIKSFTTNNLPPAKIVNRYVVIDPESSKKAGRTVDQDTLKWWHSPAMKKAYDLMLHDVYAHRTSYHVGWKTIYQEFKTLAQDYNLNVWSKGIDFDFALIESSLRDAGLIQKQSDLPYRFYNKMDVRTVMNLAKRMGWKNPVENDDVPHNALQDCAVQIWQLQDAISYMMQKR